MVGWLANALRKRCSTHLTGWWFIFHSLAVLVNLYIIKIPSSGWRGIFDMISGVKPQPTSCLWPSFSHDPEFFIADGTEIIRPTPCYRQNLQNHFGTPRWGGSVLCEITCSASPRILQCVKCTGFAASLRKYSPVYLIKITKAPLQTTFDNQNLSRKSTSSFSRPSTSDL